MRTITDELTKLRTALDEALRRERIAVRELQKMRQKRHWNYTNEQHKITTTMKQYTTPEWTAKLIELGFPKPRIDAGVTKWEGYEPICTGSYTLGELIEMLPTIVDYFTLWIGRDERSNQWFVKYHPRTLVVGEELIDALYAMVIKLKEEGVI